MSHRGATAARAILLAVSRGGLLVIKELVTPAKFPTGDYDSTPAGNFKRAVE